MMLGAIVDLGIPWEAIEQPLRTLNLPDWRAEVKEVRRGGFRAKHVTISAPPEDRHRHLHDIVNLIELSGLSPRQKELAVSIFRRLAEAEAYVHGTTPDHVHFHEVGAVDSIVDIVGTAVGWDLLGAELGISSPVAVGAGTVKIAHGEVTVPAPATAVLLQGVPLAQADVNTELTTPTGAAILKTLVSRFGPLPPMRLERVGCGAGSKDFPQRPNILRLFLGHLQPEPRSKEQPGDFPPVDHLWVIEANVDDCSGEVIGYCFGRLLSAGALDVFATPVQMKKNRPGVMLSVICEEEKLPTLEAILFAETTTLGARRYRVERTVLPRKRVVVQTEWGPIGGKLVTRPSGEKYFSPEYEECRLVAEKEGIPLRIVHDAAVAAFRQQSLVEKLD